ncbi:MAG: nucleotidyltransferase family protein [Bacteroidales bacterium]|nr:nucleotidyltransferase family protein [Bacteroidales bacterium]
MNSFDVSSLSIPIRTTILDAMKAMDEQKVKTLFVFDGDHFEGLLTIGDIQRAIINNVALTEPVRRILDKNKIYGFFSESEEVVKEKMRRMRAEVMPILDEQGELLDVWFWSDLFKKTELAQRNQINLPVVIMAGGKGTRLKPITNVIPKPLVPIGEKTILEVIMDQFEAIGCQKFYMSVNYKSDMLRFYLDQLEHKYDIDFFEEEKPLGTIGSVALLKGTIKTPFFVSNCDIVIDQDMRDVFDYHCENNNDLTIVTAVKSFQIPYGVIETGENGLMTALKEKPELTYMINTGVYILNSECIDEIPQGEFFHITQLMEKIKARGGRVGCFPVSEHAWRDMGEWPEYLRMIDIL